MLSMSQPATCTSPQVFQCVVKRDHPSLASAEPQIFRVGEKEKRKKGEKRTVDARLGDRVALRVLEVVRQSERDGYSV